MKMEFPLREGALKPWQLEMLCLAGVPGLLVPSVQQIGGGVCLVYSHPEKRSLDELLEGTLPVAKRLEFLSGVHTLATRMEMEYFLPRELISYEPRHIFADRDGDNPMLVCVPDNRTSFGELTARVLGEEWDRGQGGPLSWEQWAEFLEERIRDMEITAVFPGDPGVVHSPERDMSGRSEQFMDLFRYGIFTETKYTGLFLVILFLLGLAVGFSG